MIRSYLYYSPNFINIYFKTSFDEIIRRIDDPQLSGKFTREELEEMCECVIVALTLSECKIRSAEFTTIDKLLRFLADRILENPSLYSYFDKIFYHLSHYRSLYATKLLENGFFELIAHPFLEQDVIKSVSYIELMDHLELDVYPWI